MIKICEYCGKEFNAKYKNQKFCSRSCSHKSMSKKIEVQCETCGKTFWIKKDRFDRSEHHYCSHECHSESGRIIKKCEYCGKEFTSKKSENRRFCSHECAMMVIPKEQSTNREVIICKQCGKVFESQVSNNREFCSKECAYQWRRDNDYITDYMKEQNQAAKENFYKNVKELRKDIDLVSEYINAKTKIICRCKNHHQEFAMLPSHIIEGETGCSKCIRSKGEQRIEKYLDLHSIDYISQMKFNDCRDIQPLPFDFYLSNNNTAIEYDGEQHFKPVMYGNIDYETALNNLKKTQEHDKIKSNYCEMNGIKLIRIPYTEYENIEQILEDYLT